MSGSEDPLINYSNLVGSCEALELVRTVLITGNDRVDRIEILKNLSTTYDQYMSVCYVEAEVVGRVLSKQYESSERTEFLTVWAYNPLHTHSTNTTAELALRDALDFLSRERK